MAPNIWIKREEKAAGVINETCIAALAKDFNCPKTLIKLLAARGYCDKNSISEFLDPKLSLLHEDKAINLVPNIKDAVARLTAALAEKQKIIIYGDYDADGIISTAILYNFLKKAGFEVQYYIPDRFEDGYDINISFVKDIARKGRHRLIICVDCGTNAFEVREFVESSQCGIDVIVCDHHEPAKQEGHPAQKNAGGKYIIVNPKLECSKYPFKQLSGAGVVFKFIIAALRSFESNIKQKFAPGYLKEILDLVAIATVADVMPLTGENRVIVKAGLEMLINTRHKGLQKIISSAFREKKEKFNVYDIGFVIAPRLNASGRINNALNCIRLLTCGSEKITPEEQENLDKIVSDLEDFNKTRRNIQQEIFLQICDSYDFEDIVKNKKIFIEYSDSWHEGVLGIVASQIVKKFNIPAILFKDNDGILKGSGRSAEGFDMHKSLSGCSRHFIKYGGHSLACGITMQKDCFDSFKNEITGGNAQLKALDTARKFYYDLELDFKDISVNLLDDLKKMEPFGTGNEKPLFFTKNCNVTEQKLSQSGTHLFLKLQNGVNQADAVFFNFPESHSAEECKNLTGKNLDILFYLNMSPAGALQIVIQDLKPSR